MTKSFAPAKPRLRFDRVAVGLMRRLDEALRHTIPDGKTVIVTVTAPIRLPAKTRASLEKKIADLLVERKCVDFKDEMHGNQICVRIVASRAGAGRFFGFVHNPDPGAADVLLEQTEASVSAGEP